jgi:hypothetical protein
MWHHSTFIKCKHIPVISPLLILLLSPKSNRINTGNICVHHLIHDISSSYYLIKSVASQTNQWNFLNLSDTEGSFNMLCIHCLFQEPPSLLPIWLIPTSFVIQMQKHLLQGLILALLCWLSLFCFFIHFVHWSFITLPFNYWMNHLPFLLTCEILWALAYNIHIYILNTEQKIWHQADRQQIFME